MFKLELMKSEKIIDSRGRFNHSICASPTSPLVFCMSRYEEEKTKFRSRLRFKKLAPINVNSNHDKAWCLHGASVTNCHHLIR